MATGYIFSRDYSNLASLLPSNRNRSNIVSDLHRAYGLFDKLTLLAPLVATKDDLCIYHDPEYIECLLSSNGLQDEDELKEYGLIDDCYVFDGLPDYITHVAGGSLTAAAYLKSKQFQHVIHWDGGRHHATSMSASGFCYINDVVLSILSLRETFNRVLYVDVDLHHGDGVETAFFMFKDVYTFSIHRFDRGFFPGTGAFTCDSEHSVFNLPLREGLSDDSFILIVKNILGKIVEEFKPMVIVVVAGTDGSANDPLQEWNLTEKSFEYLANFIAELNIPTLFLGGGGYNSTDSAKCWVAMTATLLKVSLEKEIPSTSEYYDLYAPIHTRIVEETYREDRNKELLRKLQ